MTERGRNLEESGGNGNEESGGGPEKSTESDNVGSVVMRSQVSSERIT